MHHRPRRGEVKSGVFWGLGLLLVAVLLAQEPGLQFHASFDRSLTADFARGEGTPQAVGVERYIVAQEGGQGAALRTGAVLRYPAAGNLSPTRGTLQFGLQPLISYSDGRNHRFFCWGRPDTPNSLVIWKTALANDLRFRLTDAQGRNHEIIVPTAANWPVGEWHFLTFTWEVAKGELRAFVDGAAVGRRQVEGLRFEPSAAEFVLGANPAGGESAEAVLDEVKIYDRVKPPAQVNRAFESFLAQERWTALPPATRPPRQVALTLLPEPEFFFAVIADPHISAPNRHGRYAHNERVRELIAQLNALAPAFVLDCGDINTSFPQRPDFLPGNEEIKRLLAELKVPIYHAPGNHDVGNKHQLTYQGDPRYREGWFVNEDNLAVYRQYFGPDYLSFDYRDCHFVLLNNQVFNSGLPTESAQWQWLRRDLEAARGKRIFLVMHNPLFWVATDDRGTNNYEVVNEPRRSEILELCRKYRARAVFTGHTHHRISNFYRGTEFLTLPSTTFARPFGRNYGRSGAATVYDPAKIGYYVVRVYREVVRVNHVRTYAPLPPERELQASNTRPQVRALTAKAEEIADNLLGLKSVLPPPVEGAQWSALALIDGVTGANAPPARLSQYGWTTQPYREEEQEDWVEIRLAAPVRVAAVHLYPRPGGSGFPRDFTVSLSRDGQRWEQIAAYRDFSPPAGRVGEGWTEPVVVEVPEGQEAQFVRVHITAMPPMYLGRRASFMEIAVLDAAGTNYALSARGARVRAKSEAGGTRRTVDDEAWQEPAQVGVKWVRVPPAGLTWEEVEGSEGPFAVDLLWERALSLSRPAGVNYLLPVSAVRGEPSFPPPAGGGIERDAEETAFERYVRFLTEHFRGCAGGWVLYPPLEEALPADVLLTRLRTLHRAAKGVPVLLAGFRIQDDGTLAGPLPEEKLDGVPALLVDMAGKGLPEVVLPPALALAQRLQQAHSGLSVWLNLQGWTGEEWSGAYLARAFLLTQAAGVRLFWDAAAGEPGGIFDAVNNPTPVHSTVRTLNTLFDVATQSLARPPVEARNLPGDGRLLAFRTREGARLIALWRARPVRRELEPVPTDLLVRARRPQRVLGIDLLRGTMQELHWRWENGRIVVPEVQVEARPMVVFLL